MAEANSDAQGSPAEWSAWLRQALGGKPAVARTEAVRWLARNAASEEELALSRRLTGEEVLSQEDFARGLLACGANPKESGEDGKTPLMMAATEGRLEFVELLLPLSDPHAVDENGFTALMRAARAGAADCVKLLIPVSDARAKDAVDHNALMWAVRSGSAECVAALLALLSDWPAEEARESAGQTMGWAAVLGHAECVEMLLSHGAARWRGEHGKTPLMLTAQSGDVDCARLLIPHSDLQAVDSDGRNALSWATETNNVILCFALLLPFCDPLALDKKGRDVFAMAMENDAFKHADLLAERVPMERVREAVFHAPDDEMPRARALIERADLAAEMERGALPFVEKKSTPRL